jgi:hypothetical protein
MEKAIFKFNGGQGALLCSKCRGIIKTGATMSQFEKDAMLGKHEMVAQECIVCRLGIKYSLMRVEDGKFITGKSIRWVKWKEDGRAEKLYRRPQVGFSCIVDSEYGASYTWLTTQVQSFERISANELRFKTKNSTYILNKIKVKPSKLDYNDEPFQD